MKKSKVTIKPLKLNIDGLQEEILLKVGTEIEKKAIETAPVDTGNYRSQIKYDGAHEVVAQANYSAFLEYGTQEHGAKTAKALRFVKNGKEIFAKKVKGIEPNPVMRNAAKETQKEVPKIIRQIFKERGL